MLKVTKAFSIISIVLGALYIVLGIVNCIPTGAVAPGSEEEVLQAMQIAFGVVYIIVGIGVIILSVITIKNIDKRNASSFITLGILNILFTSLVTGILLLCSKKTVEDENKAALEAAEAEETEQI